MPRVVRDWKQSRRDREEAYLQLEEEYRLSGDMNALEALHDLSFMRRQRKYGRTECADY